MNPLNKEQMKRYINNVLLEISNRLDESDYRRLFIERRLGAIEAMLVASGFIVAGRPFEYKEITVKECGWFSTKLVKKKENYEQVINRLALEFLSS